MSFFTIMLPVVNESLSDQSLNVTTLIDTTLEDESNISSVVINDSSNDSEQVTPNDTPECVRLTGEKHSELMIMKTLEIKLIDCYLHEKKEALPDESSNVETLSTAENKIEMEVDLGAEQEGEETEMTKTVTEEILEVKHVIETLEVKKEFDEDVAFEEKEKIVPINSNFIEAKIDNSIITTIEITDYTMTTASVENVKVEPESVKDEIKLEAQDEEISFLRRSRRLKSIYMEPPPPPPSSTGPKSEEVFCTNIKDLSYLQSSESLKKLNLKKSSENENGDIEELKSEEISTVEPESIEREIVMDSVQCDQRLSQFVTIKDNIYIKSTDKIICKVNKTMKCDCTITEEDLKNGEMGCRYNCINRLLFIECSSKCRCGEFCDNQQFQRHNYAPVSVFRTEKKGFGIRANDDIPQETFIIEYVGEVLNNKQFDKRAKKYSKDKNRHYYFMALRSNAIIDATTKGNISRFINHSCDPNAMTQKWTGKLTFMELSNF